MCLNPIYLAKQQNFVPCRKCAECKMQRSKEWAVRLYSELKTTEKSCFITLTYDKENNPKILLKEDLQKFIKRLRKDYKVKYFACGEYGDRTLRPHFHIILFGVNFKEDSRIIDYSKKGYPLSISNTLGKYWKLGNHTIQDCSFATMIYTALYAQKDAKLLPDGYTKEFNLFSKSLGIDNLMERLDIYMQTDEVWINGEAYKIPEAVLKKAFVRYGADGKIESKDEKLIALKERRKTKMEKLNPAKTKIIEKVKIHLENVYSGLCELDSRQLEPYRKMKEEERERNEKIRKIKRLTRTGI